MANWWESAPVVSQSQNWWDAAPIVGERASQGHAGVPEIVPPGVEGYDPETGLVERQPARSSAPALQSALSGFVEGIPVAGPYLQSGVENAAAFAGSALTGRPHEEVRAEMGQMVDEAAAQHPRINAMSSLVGGVASTLPAVAAAPGLFGANAGPLAMRALAGGASGAAIGGADAGVRHGADAIIPGAVTGGAIGALAPALSDAVGGLGRWAYRKAAGVTPAQGHLARAAGADAVDDMGARLSAIGPDAMPMDLGPNLRGQAGAIATTPGRGQEVVRSAVTGRQARAGKRIGVTLDDALGAPVDTVALADDIIAQRSAAAKPLYNAAYSKPVPFTQELEDLLKRPSVGKAMQSARRLAADDETFSAATRGWFANIADDGAVKISRTPSVYELDMTKRALDDMYSTAQRAGNNNEARIFDQLRKKLIGFVDDAVPEYKQARAAFSGPASVLDSLEEGQKVFSRNLTPSQLRTQMMKMGDAEKDAFVQGARAEIAKTMGTARNDALAARSLFDKGWNKEKLGIILGDDQASRLLNSLDAETTFAATNQEITGQSVTAGRQMAQKDLGIRGSDERGMLRSALNLNVGDSLARLGDRLTGGVRTAWNEKNLSELGELLTSRDPKAMTRVIKTVQAAQRRGDLTAAKAREIIQSLAVGTSPRQPLELTVTPAR